MTIRVHGAPATPGQTAGRNRAPLRQADPTPEARIDRAKRAIADAIDELVEARISKGAARAELVDQSTSPLGRRRHLELVREGKLPAMREGRRVLVRRADIDAYLNERQIAPPPSTDDDVDGMVERIVGAGGRR